MQKQSSGSVFRPATLLKKRLWHRCEFCEFCESCEFCEISKAGFIIEHLWWLLLKVENKVLWPNIVASEVSQQFFKNLIKFKFNDCYVLRPNIRRLCFSIATTNGKTVSKHDFSFFHVLFISCDYGFKKLVLNSIFWICINTEMVFNAELLIR